MSRNVQKRSLVPLLILATCVALLGVGALVYQQFTSMRTPRPDRRKMASEPLAASFFKSLAALDVEQNELAAEVLRDATQSLPDEPALWANLAVAQMRLRDIEAAEQSLGKAMSLARDSRELALLRAELLDSAGQTQQAIDQYRHVHQVWPENIGATFSLVLLLGQVRSEQADSERWELLSDILKRAPGNLRARCEQARLAATLERGDDLRAALHVLLAGNESWPEEAREYLAQADTAARGSDFRQAALSLTFFENLIKPRPQYQQSQAQLGVFAATAIGTPMRSLLTVQLPSAEAAEADTELRFAVEPIADLPPETKLVWTLDRVGDRRPTILALSGKQLRVGNSIAVEFPGEAAEANRASICVADLNADFLLDLVLVGSDGCRIHLQQQDGSFAILPTSIDEFNQPWQSAWAVDVEADGDLDLLLSDHESELRWVRNNGDATFTPMGEFLDATSVRHLCAVDLDADGDVDLALLDSKATASVWWNERGGMYVAAPAPFVGSCLAMACGDLDRDGRFDLLAVSETGQLRQATWMDNGAWSERDLFLWKPATTLAAASAESPFLAVVDLDNNGAVDVLASASDQSAAWLRTASGAWTQLPEMPALSVSSALDMNEDGLLDLVGMTVTGPSIGANQSRAGYGWCVIQPQATRAEGDNRINSFGIGGRIEIRAGNLLQAAAIQSPHVHFGLGKKERAEVARIVWPNGSVQAEFDLTARQVVDARQRLKGSCPWVFAYDGQEFRFVKDFIWRSPLGLRINAQSTAGITQTEDWIKIPGELLAEVNGRYQVRITAELWETHFFDQVGLLAVDHPADVAVVVDERFVPRAAPDLRAIAVTAPQPLENVLDHRGQPIDAQVRAVDGDYADGFALGPYQGVGEEHWIEFDVPERVAADRRVVIVGHGWIYPTDSSLNVALSQGAANRPHGLVLEQQAVDGQWQVLRDDLGFPAGKNKDVVIALPDQSLEASRRFRLRTNMEIYWDALGWSYEVADAVPRITPLAVQVADLRHRGYSKLLPIDRRRPDTPVYEIQSTGQQWLDLEGYYTRHGDVRELLANVDDRYVIMNAGDEFVLEFAAGGDVPDGWRRDFVLVGDGWVKDGDLNTAFSRWVRPLPSHGDGEYAGPLVPLSQEPVYQRHREDWNRFHTRYVTPQCFQRGLWSATPSKTDEGTDR